MSPRTRRKAEQKFRHSHVVPVLPAVSGPDDHSPLVRLTCAPPKDVGSGLVRRPGQHPLRRRPVSAIEQVIPVRTADEGGRGDADRVAGRPILVSIGSVGHDVATSRPAHVPTVSSRSRLLQQLQLAEGASATRASRPPRSRRPASAGSVHRTPGRFRDSRAKYGGPSTPANGPRPGRRRTVGRSQGCCPTPGLPQGEDELIEAVAPRFSSAVRRTGDQARSRENTTSRPHP